MAGDVEVLVDLRGLVEPNKEAERIARVLKKLEKDVAALDKRLHNPAFSTNAPAEVVAEAEAQRAQLERQRARLAEAQKMLTELG